MESEPRLLFRRAVTKDIAAVGSLMRAAFKIWERVGFNTATLTDEHVATFLLKDGYVAEANGRIAGCVCINFVKPEIHGNEMSVPRAHRVDKTVLLDPADASFFANRTCAYPYSLAVDPQAAKLGISRQLFRFVETEAMKHRCAGILLETGANTGPLLAWYKRLGCRPVGTYTRDSQPLVFLFKSVP